MHSVLDSWTKIPLALFIYNVTCYLRAFVGNLSVTVIYFQNFGPLTVLGVRLVIYDFQVYCWSS